MTTTTTFMVEATVCGTTIERVYNTRTVSEAYNKYVEDVIDNGGLEVSNIDFIAITELTDTIEAAHLDSAAEAFATNALQHIRDSAERILWYIEGEEQLSRARLKDYISQLNDLQAYVDDAVSNIEHIATY